MADKKIAVKGCELEDSTGGGTVSISSSPSAKTGDYVSAEVLNGAYFGAVQVSVSGSDGGGTIGDGNGAGSGTITGSGAKMTDENGNPVLLEGDTATILVTGTTTSGSSTVPVKDVPITVKVKKAGQDKIFYVT